MILIIFNLKLQSFENFLNLNSLDIFSVRNNKRILLSLIISLFKTVVFINMSGWWLDYWFIFVCRISFLWTYIAYKFLNRICFHSLDIKWFDSIAVCLFQIKIVGNITFESLFIDLINVFHLIDFHICVLVAI